MTQITYLDDAIVETLEVSNLYAPTAIHQLQANQAVILDVTVLP